MHFLQSLWQTSSWTTVVAAATALNFFYSGKSKERLLSALKIYNCCYAWNLARNKFATNKNKGFFQVGGPSLPVTVNLSIRSMGPVDENSEQFSLDCYFRQVKSRKLINTQKQFDNSLYLVVGRSEVELQRNRNNRAGPELGLLGQDLGSRHLFCQRQEQLFAQNHRSKQVCPNLSKWKGLLLSEVTRVAR